jgi:hypothetical protein
MKNLIVLFLLFISIYAFSQETQTVVVQQAPQRVVVVQQTPTPQPISSKLRLNGYTLYAFDDKVDSYFSNTEYFNGKIKGGFQWGGGLEYMLYSKQSIELSYLRLDTEAPMNYYDVFPKNATFDVGTNYIMLGSNRYFGTNTKIEPYSGVQAGMAIFNVTNPENNKSDNATKFAWGFKLGLNIWATPKVGIKLQAGVLSAVQSVGGGLYFGTGGVGAGVNTYSSFFQFNIGGGLTFNLGQ